MSAKVIILEYICPALGIITGNIMCASPYKDLKKAVESGELGDLNPTPWAFMLGDCLGWTAYGIMMKNPWIFFGNMPGLLMSVWYNLGAVKVIYLNFHREKMRKKIVETLTHSQRTGALPLAGAMGLSSLESFSFDEEEDDDDNDDEEFGKNKEESTRTTETKVMKGAFGPTPRTTAKLDQLVFKATMLMDRAPTPHSRKIMVILITWLTAVSAIFFVPGITQKAQELVLAVMTNINLTLFYGAPLSTIATVVKLRDSSSIHIPTMVTNTLNGAFWTAYGFAISDYFVAVPNGLGTLFGIVQILLCFAFTRSHKVNKKLLPLMRA